MPENEEKILVLEETCIKIIDFFFNLKFFANHRVQKKIYKLSPSLLSTEANIIIYITHPEIEFIEQIEEQMKLIYEEKKSEGEDKEKEYHCIFISKITNECQEYLSKSEYKDKLITHCLNIEIFPLDYDLLSMEDPNSFKDIFIEENYSSLQKLSKIIVKFKNMYGKYNNIYIKGKYAKILSDLVKKDEDIYGVKNNNNILSCIFMDRSVDYITPFLTQFIYEGLIDEHFERQYSCVKIDPEILDKPSTAPKVKIDLSKQERLYTMIKDYNFVKICKFLPRRLALHKEIFLKIRAATEINEIKENLVYLSQVKNESNCIHTHIGLASYINNIQKNPTYKSFLTIEQRLLQREHLDFIENLLQDEISKCSDIDSILKLLCIDNLTVGNIKSTVYDKLKKDIITLYGNKERFLFENLEHLKILQRKPDNKKIYKSILNKLNLINLDVNVHNPNDTSYVFGGFSPISIRLIELLLKEGWKANIDFLNKIPGTVELPNNELSMLYPSKNKNIILLVFVGGITFSEIAAIRYINNHNEKYKFIIITTIIINPKSFINQLRNGRQKEKSDKDKGLVSLSKQLKNLFK